MSLGAGRPLAQAADAASREELLALLRQAATAARRGDRFELEQIATTLGDLRSVEIADQPAVPIDFGWLASASQVAEPDFGAIRARLDATLEVLAGRDLSTASAELAQLEALLSQPPFAQASAEAGPIERLFEWIFTQFARLLEPLFDASPGAANGITLVFGLIGLLLLGAVLWSWLRGLRGRTLRQRRYDPSDPAEGHDATSAFDEANQLAQSGDLRAAMRFLYLSALLHLDEHDRLRYDRSLTNREYLGRLRDHPALRDALEPIVATFDDVWYGDAPLDRAAFEAYARQVAALRQQA